MIKENALKYLGYLDNQVDSNTEILLNECLKELEQVTPKFMYQRYTLTHHPLTIKELNLTINYPDLIDLFDSCDRIVIIACTLGLQLDQQLRYYSKINLRLKKENQVRQTLLWDFPSLQKARFHLQHLIRFMSFRRV